MKRQNNKFLAKFKAKYFAYIEPVSTCAEDRTRTCMSYALEGS